MYMGSVVLISVAEQVSTLLCAMVESANDIIVTIRVDET